MLNTEILGCQLYGTECKSWGGKKHVKCTISESLSFSDSDVCTLPKFNQKGNTSVCRTCEDSTKWRCDDGFCIDSKNHRDGIPDCDDGSDEKPSKLILHSTLFYEWRTFLNLIVLTKHYCLLHHFLRLPKYTFFIFYLNSSFENVEGRNNHNGLDWRWNLPIFFLSMFYREGK